MIKDILRIYTDKGLGDANPAFKDIVITEFSYSGTRMGMPKLTATLMYAECLDDEWTKKEYVVFQGERYYIRNIPTSSKSNTDTRYKHELEFRVERDEILSNVYFYDTVYEEALTKDKPCSDSTEFTFYGNIEEAIDRLNCAFRYRGVGDSALTKNTSLTTDDDVVGDGYCAMLDPYGSYDRDVAKEFSFSDQSLWEAITAFYESFEIPFELRGRKIIFGRNPEVVDHKFEYGYDNELLTVGKKNANAKVINRITMIGSSENIPYYYPNETEYGHISVVADDNNKFITNDKLVIGNMSQMLAAMTPDTKAVLRKYELDEDYEDRIIPITRYSYSFDDEDLSLYNENETKVHHSISDKAQTAKWNISVEFKVPTAGRVVCNKLMGSVWVKGTTKPSEMTNLMTRSANNISLRKFGSSIDLPIDTSEDVFNFGILDKGSYTFKFSIPVPNRVGVLGEPVTSFCCLASAVIAYDDGIHNGYYWQVGNKEYVGESSLGVEITGGVTDEMIGEGFKWIASDRIAFQGNLMPRKYRNTLGDERFYEAIDGIYENPATGEPYIFPNPYDKNAPCEHIYKNENIKPTLKGIENTSGKMFGSIADIAYDDDDNDMLKSESSDESDKNDSLKYAHPYFYIKLNLFDGEYGFDLFKHASQTDPMTIQMTDGPCNGCKFKIQAIEFKDKKGLQYYKNPVLTKGPDGDIVEGGYSDKVKKSDLQEWQQDTTKNSIWICVQKDAETFGSIMPNRIHAYRPHIGDTFNIINIDLPQGYILAAEKKLEEEGIKFMAENNEEKFTFDISASRIFFAENPDVLAQLDEYSKINVIYNGKTYELFVSGITINYKDNEALPEIQVSLTDTIAVGESFVQEVTSQAASLIAGSVNGTGRGGADTALLDKRYLNKQKNDRTPYKLSTDTGIEIGNFISGSAGGIFYKDPNTGLTYIEVDSLKVRMKAIFEELEIAHVDSIGGKVIITPGDSIEVTNVLMLDDVIRCYFKSDGGDKGSQCRFQPGDQVQCQEFNVKSGSDKNASNRYYWRAVKEVNNDLGYVDLFKDNYHNLSETLPEAGDVMCQLGSQTDKNRQSAIVFSTVDAFAPCITLYNGINDYTLDGKEVIQYGVDKTKNPPRPFFRCYGEMYVGPRDGSTYIRYTPENGVEIKGKLSVDSKVGDKLIEEYIKEVAPPVTQEDIEGFVEAIVDPKIEGIQNQIDGVIETWFYNGVPTLTNYPASEWDDNAKIAHLGDLYYDNDTGTAYRFSQDTNGTYYWNKITDEAITKALAAAQAAQDTADNKRRVFTKQPTDKDAYDVGDLWVNATYPGKYKNDILRCVAEKESGVAFKISDWMLASDYTDDTVANAAISRLQAWADDGMFSPIEIQSLELEFQKIQADKNNYDRRCGQYSDVISSIPSFDSVRKTYDHRYSDYYNILEQILDSPRDSNGCVPVPSTFANIVSLYYQSTVEFDSVLTEASKKYSVIQVAQYKYLAEALNQSTEVNGGLVMTTLISLGYKDKDGNRHTMAGMNGFDADDPRTIASWWGGVMADMFATPAPTDYATALVRMDGSAYFSNGNIGFEADGSGWLGNKETGIKFTSTGRMEFGNGIVLNINGRDEGMKETIESLINSVASLNTLLVPCDKNGGELNWKDAMTRLPDGTLKVKSIKATVGFYGTSFVSALGLNDTPGTGGTGGVDELRKLLDVTLLNPKDGESLVYDGSKWINLLIEHGLSETQVDNLIESKGYITSSSADSKFVKKTGDSMSGTLKINQINSLTNSLSMLAYKQSGITGVTNTQWMVGANDVQGVIRSSNASLLHVRYGISTHATIWDSYNDGSGSGLDADMLDTWHATGLTGKVFIKSSYVINNDNEANDDDSCWYKIASVNNVLYSDNDITLLLHSAYNKDYAIVFIRSRGEKVRGPQVALTILAGNIAPDRLRLYYTDWTMNDERDNYSELWVKLTKGWQYLDARVLAETRGSSVEAAVTTLYTKRVHNNTERPTLETYIEASYMELPNTVAAAKQLATARTLWGQSFDGSANVSGNMTGVGSVNATGDFVITKDNAVFKASDGTRTIGLYASVNRGIYDFTISKWILGLKQDGTQTWLMGGNVGIGTQSPGYKLDVDGTLRTTGQATVASLKIGDVTISYDATNKGLKVSGGGLYSDSYISALGASTASGGSGTGYNRLDEWADYTTAKAGYVLSAKLGMDLKDRIDNLPTTSVNPYALTIKRNGTTIATYYGGAEVTADITDVASANTLANHISDTTVHITSAERTKWNKVVTDFAAITGNDSDNIINKWEEVVAFLDTYTEADTLANLLSNKADKTQLSDYVTVKTAQTITGVKTFASILLKKANTMNRCIADTDAGYDYIVFGDCNEGTIIRGKEISFQNTVGRPRIWFKRDGDIVAGRFMRSDGKANQFLKANGGVDETVYLDKATFDDFKEMFDSMFTREADGSGGYRIKANYGLYTESFLSALGLNSTSAGGGGFGLMREWPESEPSATTNDALGANLGYSLYQAIREIMSGAAMTVNTTGAGNAITSISKNGTALNVVKGSTFLTSHQSLTHLLNVSGENGTANTLNVLINKLTEGSSTPSDNDYFISQYVNGGTSTTTYHRRKMSKLWDYIRPKGDARYVTSLAVSGDYLRWYRGSNYTNMTVPYATKASKMRTEYTVEGITHSLIYFSGQPVQGTDPGQAFEGSSADSTLWSFPEGGATINSDSGKVNIMTIRMMWSGSWLHDIFACPNRRDLWHRYISNNTAYEWEKILTSGNYRSIADSAYVKKSGDTMSGALTAELRTNKISDRTNAQTLLSYKTSGNTGVTAEQWMVGAVNSQGVIRSSNSNLIHFRNGAGACTIWDSLNDGSGSGLDADLLDGFHNGELTAKRLNVNGPVSDFNGDLPHNGIFKWYDGVPNQPNDYGVMLQISNMDTPAEGTDSLWLTQLASSTNNRLYYRTQTNNRGWNEWSTIAFLTDNVASATKLQTARNIWGQPFDGTGGITGDMTQVGNILPVTPKEKTIGSATQSFDTAYLSNVYSASGVSLRMGVNGGNTLIIMPTGSVGVGMVPSSSYRLDVNGVIKSSKGIFSDGYVSALGQNTSSDERLKDIVGDACISVGIIAKAPSVNFKWKNTGLSDAGSIAQYWERANPALVRKMPNGYLGLDYGKTALISVISVAKSTLQMEARIKQLEQRVAELELALEA